MIPQSFISDLLNRVDIVDVVGRYVQLKKAGANFQGLCPFHNEKTPSYTLASGLLGHARNTIGFVGFCDPDTPGGKLLAA